MSPAAINAHIRHATAARVFEHRRQKREAEAARLRRRMWAKVGLGVVVFVSAPVLVTWAALSILESWLFR